ncbi:MAG: succinyl-diaminopimelate desuccinylase [Rhodospirillales bacterium]|nr:succinyl-diaminopimelate desuccinylase [Rhodospirillales bacterium]
MIVDPLELSRALIRCASVTPADAGALGILQDALEPLGFSCERMRFEQDGTPTIDNLYARRGRSGPNFCFAGHTDVVPPGDLAAWSVDPFAAEVRDGRLYGRGAADMKAAIACFVAAVSRCVVGHDGTLGSISLLITGDEEGPAVNGTRKMLEWLNARGERIDACLVGEPTNPDAIGDMIKIGRRGSLNAEITVVGVQGHSAYPERADNPIPHLVRMLAAIDATPLDHGTPHFQPSTITFTSVDVGNPATNVIPARARARLNVRFNDSHTGKSVAEWLERQCAAVSDRFQLAWECSGEAFLCAEGLLSHVVAEAVRKASGREPDLSTTGGTSDARFIKAVCPVCEFGMVGDTAHKVDENVAVADIEALTRIYEQTLLLFFAESIESAAC